MRSNKSTTISLNKIILKAPKVISNLPAIIKGIKIGKPTGPTTPTGLGWTWEKAVKSNPNGLAFLYEDSRFTYHEFNLWANQICHYFLDQGVKKGDTVAIFIENRPELMACVLGLAKIGAVSAMVNTQQTGNVLTHSLNLVKPKYVIVGEELTGALDSIKSSVDIADNKFYCLADRNTRKDPGQVPGNYLNLAKEIRHYPTTNPYTTNKIYFNDPCFYIYTSGTTGMPKAGIFKHGRWMQSYGGFGIGALRLKPGDILYCTLPLYHATGLVICWSSVMSGSAGLAIKRKFSASSFWSDIRYFNANAIGYVGELCRYLMALPEQNDDKDNPVVKMVGNGLRPNVWKPFKKRFGIKEVFELYAASDGNIGFLNMFNLDNTVGVTSAPFAIVEYDRAADKPVLTSKGFMKKVKRGGTGLLLAEITANSPLAGYTDQTKTNKVIERNVFKNGDQWFNTGDLMRDIGFKHTQFVDRLGDTYRWKGENVSAAEVENLISSYQEIEEVVAYGVEIPNTNGRAGMASITPNIGVESFNFKDFYLHVKNTMPHYAAPVFIRMKATMDTTSTFKYKKTDLKEEAFNIAKTSDPIYAALPGSTEYTPITQKVFDEIMEGEYRF
ncbi:MAG: long-chain-acyl-CoA synthetase [Alteromonadaceae bacterium]|nr:MAG: long-chain-acyl-CoA synthetase [Alteromonadaceae bacterium]